MVMLVNLARQHLGIFLTLAQAKLVWLVRVFSPLAIANMLKKR
jgi:hypothetical protein